MFCWLNQVRSLWRGDGSLNSGALILEGSTGETVPFLGTSLTLNHAGIMTALNSSWTDRPLSFASPLGIVYVWGPKAIITLTDITIFLSCMPAQRNRLERTACRITRTLAYTIDRISI